MATRRIIIHGGMHKTGSSFIQNTLFENADELRRHGVLYPESGLNTTSPQAGRRHSLLRTSLVQEGPRSYAMTSLIRELESSGCDVAIISYEGFVGPQFDLSILREAVEGFDPTLIVYLRNPIDYIESKYREWIRLADFAGELHRFHRAHAGFMEFPGVIDRATELFGADRVVVRPIELVRPRSDLVADLLDAVGLSDRDLRLPPTTFDNPRSDNPATLTRLMANRLWLAGDVDVRSLAVDRAWDHGGSGRLIRDELVAEILTSTWPGYEGIVARYGLDPADVDRQWVDQEYDDAFADTAVRAQVVEHLRELDAERRRDREERRRQAVRIRRRRRAAAKRLVATTEELAAAQDELAATNDELTTTRADVGASRAEVERLAAELDVAREALLRRSIPPWRRRERRDL